MRISKFNIPGLVTILVLLAGWEILVRSGAAKFDYLPAPSGILLASVSLIVSGELFSQALHTVESILIGWTAAAAIGIGLGLALGLSPLLRRWSLASFEVLRPLPAIAFLPLALLLFNFSLTTELVLMIYASVWPVFINTMGGVMGVTSRLYDVSRTLRLSRMQTLVKVIVPAAAPAIVTGCRLSMGLTLGDGDRRRNDRQPARTWLCGDQRTAGDAAAAHVRVRDFHRDAVDRAECRLAVGQPAHLAQPSLGARGSCVEAKPSIYSSSQRCNMHAGCCPCSSD